MNNMRLIAKYSVTALVVCVLVRLGCELFWFMPRGARAWANLGILLSASCAIAFAISSRVFSD
jgi:hypothetical protein